MAGRYASRSVELAVEFQLPDPENVPLAATVTQVKVYETVGGLVPVLTLETDFATYKRVKDEAAFGYSIATHDGDGESFLALYSHLPVVIELRLDGAAAQALKGASPDAAADGLISALGSGEPSLLASSAYVWLAVLQEQESRPGATTLSGVRSVHARSGPPYA